MKTQRKRLREKKVVNRALLPNLLRIFLAFVSFVLQIVGGTLLSSYLKAGGYAIYTLFQVLSFVFVLFILRQGRAIDYSLAWSIAILALPFVGLLLYGLWGSSTIFRKPKARLAKAEAHQAHLRFDPKVRMDDLKTQGLLSQEAPEFAQIHYLASQGFACYPKTKATYFKNGEGYFEALLKDISEAQSTIFLQYFIVAEGSLWKRFESLLVQKARAGLEIRLMVDDLGAAPREPKGLSTLCEKEGILLLYFNPILRNISRLYANYRNHRKLCIIDGKIAYYGGANLADEYANLVRRFGHWKDAGIRLEGEVCREALFSFLSLWEEESGLPIEDSASYLYAGPYDPVEDCSLYVPFHDSPLNNPQNTALDLYLSLINTARTSLYIVSPYFIVPQQMVEAICRVAQSGVDVRLLAPGTPDKTYVYIVSRSYYEQMLTSGVRIFEYKPGFSHAKSLMVDGKRAVTGSINMDYRSFFLNFENAVYIANAPVVESMEADFHSTLELCVEKKLDDWRKRHFLLKIAEGFLKAFAPLL